MPITCAVCGKIAPADFWSAGWFGATPDGRPLRLDSNGDLPQGLDVANQRPRAVLICNERCLCALRVRFFVARA